MTKNKVVLGFSGSRHSIAAAALLNSQNVDLIAVHFRFDQELSSLFPQLKCTKQPSLSVIEKIAKKCGVSLRVIDLTGELSYWALDPLVESRLSANFFNPCGAFYKKVILNKLQSIKEKSGASQIATGNLMDYPLKGIPESLLNKVLEKLPLEEFKEIHLNEFPVPHDPDTCVDQAFWLTPYFNSLVPNDLVLNGRFHPEREGMPPEHGGVFKHYIGEVLKFGLDFFIVASFNIHSKTWLLKPIDSTDYILKYEARKIGEHFETSYSNEYFLKRDRTPQKTDAYRVKIYNYIEDHVLIEFQDMFNTPLSPGESFSYHFDHHPDLKGSFIIRE